MFLNLNVYCGILKKHIKLPVKLIEKIVGNIMKIEGFNKRLKKALDVRGFPPLQRGRIQELAELMSMTHRGAGKWLSGETCPPVKKLIKLAERLNICEKWLRSGEGDMLKQRESVHLFFEKTIIPLFSLKELDYTGARPTRFIQCEVKKASLTLFAMMLEGQAMSPRFSEGTILILDKGRTPVNGDFVLFRGSYYPFPIFRRLVMNHSKYYLLAENSKFDNMSIPSLDKILGTLIQTITHF